jgi:competence ComEA-like helix-hairpin-helix protein
MAFYSRHQLLVILAVVAAFGGGLAIDRWRRAHPDAVERLERFDREDAGETLASDSPSPPPRPPKLRPDSDSQASAPIDINRATADELTSLPGIGPALAARIVEARERAPFTSVEDLGRVRGVGPAKRDRLRPLVTVGAPP